MIGFDVATKLMDCFENSFINHNLEFIAHKEANEYICLKDCENEFAVKCKVLEWFSRGAYKSMPFGERKNKTFHKFMLNGINKFLGTDFNYDDMDKIYTKLGNCCNHTKTACFVGTNYDFSVLEANQC